MVESPPNAIEAPDFQFKLYSRLNLLNDQSELKADHPIKLVATASKYGFIFIGTPFGVQCIRTADIAPVESVSRKKILSSYKRRDFHLGTQPTHLDVSCDNELLAVSLIVDGCAVLQVYIVQSVGSAQVRKLNEVRLSGVSGVFVSDLQWNPGVNNMIAVVMSDGSAAVIEFKDGKFNINSIPQNAQASCLCWSPKGKQVVIGTKNGSLIQLKPELKVVKTCDPPQLGPSTVSVISVHWLSNFQFIAVYKDATDPSAKSSVVVINTPKNLPPKYVYYEDLLYEFKNSRPEHYFIHQQLWQILVLGTTNSIDTIVLKMEGDNWVQWMQEEGSRAELPLNQNFKEVHNCGMAIDYSSTQPVPIGEKLFLGPMPLLLMYAQNGVLSIYNMVNRVPNVPNLCQLPQPLQDTSGLHLFVEPQNVGIESASNIESKEDKMPQNREPERAPAVQPPVPSVQPINVGVSPLSPPTSSQVSQNVMTPPSSQLQATSAGYNFSYSLPSNSPIQPISFRPPLNQSPFAAGASLASSPAAQPLINQASPMPFSTRPNTTTQSAPISNFSFSLQNTAGKPTLPNSAPPWTSPDSQSQPKTQLQKSAQLPHLEGNFSSNIMPSLNTGADGVQSQNISGAIFSQLSQPQPKEEVKEREADKVIVSTSNIQQMNFGMPLNTGIVPQASTEQIEQPLPTTTSDSSHVTTGVLKSSQAYKTILQGNQESHVSSGVPVQQQENDPLPEEQPVQQDEPEPIDRAKENELIMEHIRDIIGEFNSEMETKQKNIKDHVSQIEKNLKDNYLKDKLLNDIESLKNFENRLRDSNVPDLASVKLIGSNLMEMFGWYEKIKAKERMTKNSGYIELMESQDLDPVTKHYLKNIDKYVYYLESQIKQAKNKLGTFWDNAETTMDIPAMESIYQALVAHHNILAANKVIIEKYEMTLKKINKRRMHRTSRKKVGDLELSTLADRLLETKLGDSEFTSDTSLKEVSNNYIALSNKPGQKIINEEKLCAFYEWHKNHKVVKTKVSSSSASLPMSLSKDNTFISVISPSKQSTPYIPRDIQRKVITDLPRKNLFPLATVDDSNKANLNDRSLKHNLVNVNISVKGSEGDKIGGIDAPQNVDFEKNERIPTPAFFKHPPAISNPKTVANVLSSAWGSQSPVFNSNPLLSSKSQSLAPTTKFSVPPQTSLSSGKTSPLSTKSQNVISSPESKPITSPSEAPQRNMFNISYETGPAKTTANPPNSSVMQAPNVSIFPISSNNKTDSTITSTASTKTSSSFGGPYQSPVTSLSTAPTNNISATTVSVSPPFSNPNTFNPPSSTANRPNQFSPQGSGTTVLKTSGSFFSNVSAPNTHVVSTVVSSTSVNTPSTSAVSKTALSGLSFGKSTPSSNTFSSVNFGSKLATTTTSFASVTTSTPSISLASGSPGITTPIFGGLSNTGAPIFGSSTSNAPVSSSTFNISVTTSPNLTSSSNLEISTTSAPITTSLMFGGSSVITFSTTTPSVFGTSTGTTTTTSSMFGNPSIFGGTALATPTSSVFGSSANAVSSAGTIVSSSLPAAITTSSIFGSSTGTPSMFGSPTTPNYNSSPVSSTIPTSVISTVSTTASITPTGTLSSTTSISSISALPSTTNTPIVASVFGGGVTTITSKPLTIAATTATPLISTTTAPLIASSTGAPLANSAPTTSPVSSTSVAPLVISTVAPSHINSTSATPLVNTTSASSVSIFGGATTQATTVLDSTNTTSSVFGSFKSPTTTSQPFFSNPSSFGAVTTSSTSIFGSTTKSSAFGTSTTTSFGTPSTTSFAVTTSSFFGSPNSFVNSTTPSFGSSSESGSIFGAANALSSTSFFSTSATTTTTSSFGNQSAASIFGGSSSFGTPTTTSSASFFGSVICSPTSTANVFGSTPATTTNSIFGGGASFTQKPTFGQSGNLFGQTSPSPGNFGSSGGSIFGGTPSFNSPNLNQQGNIFQTGNTSPGLFSNTASTGFSSPQAGQTAFGAAPAFQSPQRSFGGAGAPVFGSSPSFGSAPSFGGSPSFGNSPGKVFGSPAAAPAAPSFGATPQQASSTFENLAQQETVSFGNLAQQQPFQNSSFVGNSFNSWR